jgi:hypothetical protein
VKPKLLIFRKYIASLLPIELRFALKKVDTTDADLLRIKNELARWSTAQEKEVVLDETIDKRKYSYLKRRMEQVLEDFDVDVNLQKIQEFERKVLGDCISSEEETALVKLIRNAASNDYNFMRFYELVNYFRQYLLIRFRRKLYPIVDKWLRDQRDAYDASKKAFFEIHNATVDVIKQYEQLPSDAGSWESLLLGYFENPKLDGFNRYAAAVRLWFLYMNQGAYTKMEQHLQHVEQRLLLPDYLGRRIIANYYANQLLLQSKLNRLEEAAQCGWYSIMSPTNDYLFYVVNLSSVLLRQGKAKEAFQLMRSAFPEMRKTSNLHNKMGFIAQYVHCLIDINRAKDAEQFAESYLSTHKKEVLSNHWHLFFAGYFRALVKQEKFARLRYLVQKYKIRDKELDYSKKKHYLPFMSWYITLADFMEGYEKEEQAIQKMRDAAIEFQSDPLRFERIREQLKSLKAIQPDMINRLWSDLFKK